MVIEESTYKGKYLAGQGFQRRMFSLIIREIASDFQPPALLDVGCSDGTLTKQFASLKKFDTVVGIDSDYTDIQLAMKKFPEASFVQAPVESVELDMRFNTIVMFQTIEHLAEPIEVLKKLLTLLDDDGVLLITTINAFSMNRRLGKSMGMIKECTAVTENDILVGHHRLYDSLLLRKHLAEGGFEHFRLSGLFYKPFSNAQMELYSDDVVEGLYKVGKELPMEYCALLYAVCSK